MRAANDPAQRTRIATLEAAVHAYAARSGFAAERVAEWVLSDLAKGHTVGYVLGWLEHAR